MGGSSVAAVGFKRLALALALTAGACTSMNVSAETLAGTHWQVTSINGHSTPVSDRFRMSFEAGRFAARFGCNSGGGSYRLQRDQIVVLGPVIATQMACAPLTDDGPDLMKFEREGFAVASHPMSMHWADGRHLTLGNASGSIELQRLP